jgi:hypothetical protein
MSRILAAEQRAKTQLALWTSSRRTGKHTALLIGLCTQGRHGFEGGAALALNQILKLTVAQRAAQCDRHRSISCCQAQKSIGLHVSAVGSVVETPQRAALAEWAILSDRTKVHTYAAVWAERRDFKEWAIGFHRLSSRVVG